MNRIFDQLCEKCTKYEQGGDVHGDIFKLYKNEVIDIIQNGSAAADAIAWTDPGGVGAKVTARQELQNNRATIITDVTTWIGTTYPNFAYDEAVCQRDAGLIVDALSYDI